jgi:Tfp pilus assembly ATPase PilU
MVGATGTGKSTTLASMLEWRNQQMSGHILTIEDPIEFLFTNKKSIVNQREVGRDTQSLQVALKNALRQAPDCILIGEIRDRETMSSALSYALSGHLVLSTLHANNSYHALGRILSFYTPEARPDPAVGPGRGPARHRLAAPAARQRGGRVPAVEVLLNTKLVSELIEKGDLSGVKEAMEKVAGRRLADLRDGHRAPDHRRPTSRATKAWPMPIRRPTCCGACRTTRRPVSRVAPKKEETRGRHLHRDHHRRAPEDKARSAPCLGPQ